MRIAIAITAVLVGAAAFAHDGPDDRIHDLTHKIEDEGATPKLLSARAYEYRSLGQYDEAIADYEAAITASPNYAPALHGLAQTLLRAERLNDAEVAAHAILAKLDSDHDTASAHALHARIEQRRENYDKALTHWRKALALGGEIDWYLGEAACLRAMKRFEDAAKALESAREKNPSAAIYRAWIAALIDAEREDMALTEIEDRLENARWKSTWLIFRARALGAKGNIESARVDARRALKEINTRLDPDRPDGFLLADAAAAYAILGDDIAAHQHFEQARELRVPNAYLASLQ